jgi:hypothetical protein
MTDDLVKRLRDNAAISTALSRIYDDEELRYEAADRIKAMESLFSFALKLRDKQKVYLKTGSEEDLIALKKAEEIFDDIVIPAWDSLGGER